MRNFRETTKKYWEYKEGQADRSTWMTPLTTYDNQTDLRNESNARSYFPNWDDFAKFQALKAELDPTDLFSNIGTIP